MSGMGEGDAQRLRARELNELIRYTMWSVFRVSDRTALDGSRELAGEGFPERICRFASHHTGVGISRDEVIRQGLPIPPGDYMAETQEEAIVMYADKFHTKTAPPAFLTAAGYAARVGRFGADKVAAFEALREQFGDPDLASLSGQYGQPLAS